MDAVEGAGAGAVAAAGGKAGVKEEEDQTNVRWKDPNWLAHFALKADTAMDYFMCSQFYDRESNNEQIRMQRLSPALMRSMEGVEYQLEPSAPNATVFVITKLRRAQPDLSRPATVAVYYIVEGEVFQAPHATVVLANRVSQMMYHLQKSFGALRANAEIDARGEYRWKKPAGAGAAATGTGAAKLGTVKPNVSERRAINQVLYSIFDKNERIMRAGERREEERIKAAEGAAGSTAGDPMSL